MPYLCPIPRDVGRLSTKKIAIRATPKTLLILPTLFHNWLRPDF